MATKIIHIIITIIINNITCMIILLLFITIIRVSPPLGRYNAINGQVSILQSNTTCQTTEMQTHGWKNQMESYFCLSLKRPVSHKGQGMCKTSLRPAAAMSKVNMKRVQAGVSPPLFRAGPIAPPGRGRQMYHILNIGARPGRLLAPWTQPRVLRVAERQDMSVGENNFASSSPFQRAFLDN